ncbi:hypothetical protein Godav_027997 [Gossypium davidsonii]|uniref:Reverse transcriptase zinc-binding domain-containing protein n=2 Tax=Gossypium TaxID=3633 RepID=A0A7J8RZD2_GOSDV|nr:hypothetical protein [Gossypium davidsonii]
MADDINALLKNLKFSEEESVRVISSNIVTNYQGFEAWAVGKIMAIEKPNREAMYRVLRSLWFTKYDVNFVALNEEVIFVKFGCVEDEIESLINMMPWLFDNCLFAMLPFVKDKELETYEFNISPFWLRIYNIPLEYMDRQIAMDVGKAIGELVAIDWKDRNGGWTEIMRLKVKINVSNPLRRVVSIANDTNEESKSDTREEDGKSAQKGKGKDAYPYIDTNVIRQTSSDHEAIMLDTLGKKPKEKQDDPRLFFKFEACWARDEKAKKIVKDSCIATAVRSLRQGFGWLVGNGKSVDIHKDNWGFEGLNGDAFMCNREQVSEKKVYELWVPNSKRWDRNRSSWHTTKAAYSWLILKKMGMGPHRLFWKMIWQLKIIPKIRNFAWRVGHEILPTNSKIASIRPLMNLACQHCGADKETLIHALKDCPTARETLMIHNFSERPMLPIQPTDRKWIKPSRGVVKINVDAAIEEGKMGLGVIVRDEDGFVLGGYGCAELFLAKRR